MKKFFYLLLGFSLLISNISQLQGQIYSNTKDTIVKNAENPVDTITGFANNSIFVFDSLAKVKLVARCTVPKAKFNWYQFNTTSLKFDIDTKIKDTVASGLKNGGYQVIIQDSLGHDTLKYTAWVYLDSISLKLDKDENGGIWYDDYHCTWTDFRIKSLTRTKLIYYNLNNKPAADPNLYYNLSTGDTVYSGTRGSNYIRIYLPMPYEEKTFYVQVIDRFNAKSNIETIKYKPVITKALTDTVLDPTHVINGLLSAPMEVKFKNKSKNGNHYTWLFQMFPTETKIDSVEKYETDNTDTISRILGIRGTGNYTVKLVSESANYCTDTLTLNFDIADGRLGKEQSSNNGNPGTGSGTGSGTTTKVESPKLPDYFLPDQGQTYKIYNTSIRHFRITIYSRWGQKVYEKEHDDMLTWDGWDGKIGNNEASTGLYYYVLEVISYDIHQPDAKLMRPNGKYSGFFYLFR
jgi:hypothetical protein